MRAADCGGVVSKASISRGRGIVEVREALIASEWATTVPVLINAADTTNETTAAFLPPIPRRVYDQVDDVAGRADDAELHELHPVRGAPEGLDRALWCTATDGEASSAGGDSLCPASRPPLDESDERAGTATTSFGPSGVRSIARSSCRRRDPSGRTMTASSSCAHNGSGIRRGGGDRDPVGWRVLREGRGALADVHLHALVAGRGQRGARASASSGMRSIQCTSGASSPSTAAAYPEPVPTSSTARRPAAERRARDRDDERLRDGLPVGERQRGVLVGVPRAASRDE